MRKWLISLTSRNHRSIVSLLKCSLHALTVFAAEIIGVVFDESIWISYKVSSLSWVFICIIRDANSFYCISTFAISFLIFSFLSTGYLIVPCFFCFMVFHWKIRRGSESTLHEERLVFFVQEWNLFWKSRDPRPSSISSWQTNQSLVDFVANF